MQYEKFEQWMIGKRVREIATGDTGTIIDRYEYNEAGVMVRWDSSSAELWLYLSDITFEEPKKEVKFESITIDGKRYKLVPIEEE